DGNSDRVGFDWLLGCTGKPVDDLVEQVDVARRASSRRPLSVARRRARRPRSRERPRDSVPLRAAADLGVSLQAQRASGRGGLVTATTETYVQAQAHPGSRTRARQLALGRAEDPPWVP